MEAWQQTAPGIISNARLGTWVNDYFRSGPDPEGRYCSLEEIM